MSHSGQRDMRVVRQDKSGAPTGAGVARDRGASIGSVTVQHDRVMTDLVRNNVIPDIPLCKFPVEWAGAAGHAHVAVEEDIAAAA